MTNRPRRYDLIVFDWDGTLYDSTALITRCIQAAAQDLGMPRPNDHDASFVIGLGLVEALRHAVPELPEGQYPELARRYRHHYLNDQHAVTLFAGVPTLLAELKERNHWLAVATGKSRRGLDEALQQSDLGRLFDGTRTADETASKPHPMMLQQLMREFGVEPERTLMIGDTTHDMLLASNAGADRLAVAYGAHEPSTLIEHGPQVIAHSVTDLRNWLREHA